MYWYGGLLSPFFIYGLCSAINEVLHGKQESDKIPEKYLGASKAETASDQLAIICVLLQHSHETQGHTQLQCSYKSKTGV